MLSRRECFGMAGFNTYVRIDVKRRFSGPVIALIRFGKTGTGRPVHRRIDRPTKPGGAPRMTLTAALTPADAGAPPVSNHSPENHGRFRKSHAHFARR